MKMSPWWYSIQLATSAGSLHEIHTHNNGTVLYSIQLATSAGSLHAINTHANDIFIHIYNMYNNGTVM